MQATDSVVAAGKRQTSAPSPSRMPDNEQQAHFHQPNDRIVTCAGGSTCGGGSAKPRQTPEAPGGLTKRRPEQAQGHV